MFLLGSFTDGMFKGAQSAMSMYTGIQGILAAQDSAAMSKKVEEQRLLDKANANVPGWTEGGKQPAAIPQPTSADWREPAAPATTPTVPGGDKPFSTTPASAPVPKPTDTTATPSGITSTPADARDPDRTKPVIDAVKTGLGALDRERQGYDYKPPIVATPQSLLTQGLPLAPTSVSPTNMPTFDVPQNQPGALSSGQGTVAGTNAQTGAPRPAGGAGPNMSVPMTNQPIGATIGGWRGQPTSAVPLPPATTGATAPGNAPQAAPAPAPPAQPPPPPPVQQSAISPAPTTGSGVGSRFASLLSQVNPIGTAHAEPAAGDVNAPQPGTTPHPPDTRGAPGGDQPMGVGGAPSGSPIADATIQGAPAPDTRSLPSTQRVENQPPTAPTQPGQTTPGPVPTKATVPGTQPGTAVQSETQPIGMAPPVSGWYGRELERVDPGLARLAHQLVDQLGANAVTYDQVAAHMYRESRFKSGVTGPFGEHGVMQVMPDTQAWLERNILHRHVDASTPEGGMTLGITYLRYLANDLHLGGNTLQTNLAYMRGPGAVKQINQIGLEASQRGEGKYNLKNALGWLDDMYRTGGPGSDSAIKLDKNQFQGGALSENHVQVTPQDAMKAAAQGPDATLNYIATTGSPGLGMSELWIQYQGALERQAIWSGHLDMLPHIADFVLQQSHQGALSSLAAADAALASGNMQGAAGAIARAHAFFPDGSYVRIGVSADGKSIVGQQFGEGANTPLGKPIAITREMIQAQMMALGNPHDYVKTLDAHRKNNAEIEQMGAHSDWYRAQPGIKEAQEEGRNQRAADAAAAKEHEAELKREQATTLRETQEKNTNELDKDLNTKYDINSKPPEVSSQDWANRSEIERQIRLPISMGGAHLGGATGAAIAEGMTTADPATKQPAIRIVPTYVDKEKTKQGGWAIVDNKGQVRATLGIPAGNHILQLPGIAARNPMNPPANQNPPANPQKQALNIGSGMGSQQAQQQGLNQNIAGVPTSPMQQPQQTAIG